MTYIRISCERRHAAWQLEIAEMAQLCGIICFEVKKIGVLGVRCILCVCVPGDCNL